MYLQREDSKVVGKGFLGLISAMFLCVLNFQEQFVKWDHMPLDLFVGQLKSSLTCSVCGFRSTMFDPFWDLSIPIAKVSPYYI